MVAKAASGGHQSSSEGGYKLRVPQGCVPRTGCDEMAEVALIILENPGKTTATKLSFPDTS